jgi:hypothetical protein
MKLHKDVILENFSEHLKKHSGKYLAGIGGLVAGGLATDALSDDTPINRPVTNIHTVNHVTEAPGTDWENVATKGLMAGTALGAGALALNNKAAVSKGATNTISALNKGVAKTKQWVADEKRKENPPPVGVDTGMQHGPQKKNNAFYKKEPIREPRDLNKPTQTAMDNRSKPLVQPGDIKRKTPLTSPQIVPKRIITKRNNAIKLKNIVKKYKKI